MNLGLFRAIVYGPQGVQSKSRQSVKRFGDKGMLQVNDRGISVMRVTIERSSFLRALNHVQSVVERRNTIPILSNVLIQAAGANLRLTATDSGV